MSICDYSVRFLASVPTDIPSGTAPKLTADVESLNLSINSLHVVPETVLPALTNLRILDLSGNHLTRLPSNISVLHSLQELRVARNQLDEFPASLSQLTNLEVIDASSNCLHQLGTRKLREVNLEHNKLIRLPYSLGQSHQTLLTLLVEANPLEEPFSDLLGKVNNDKIRTLRRKASLQWDRVKGSVKTTRNDMEDASLVLADLVKKMRKDKSPMGDAHWDVPEIAIKIEKKKSMPVLFSSTASLPQEKSDTGLVRDSGYATDSQRNSVVANLSSNSEQNSPTMPEKVLTTAGDSGANQAVDNAEQRRRARTVIFENEKKKNESKQRRQTMVSTGRGMSRQKEAVTRIMVYLRDLWDLECYRESHVQKLKILTSPIDPSPAASSRRELDAEDRLKKREKRTKIITELLETEKTYVRELLALDRLYVQPARLGCLTVEECRLVFGNLSALTMFHSQHFLPQLQKVSLPTNYRPVTREKMQTLATYSLSM